MYNGILHAGAHRPSVRSGVVRGVLRVLLYVAICVIFLVPFAWMFFGSLRAEREIFAYLMPFSWRTFVPIEWTLDSYLTILGLNETGRRSWTMNFGRNLLNSLIVSTAVVISSLFFNTMGAYFFARLPFPKKNWLLMYVLATFLIPFEVTIVPLYIVVRNSAPRQHDVGDDRALVRQPVRDLLADAVHALDDPLRPGRGRADRWRRLLARSSGGSSCRFRSPAW